MKRLFLVPSVAILLIATTGREDNAVSTASVGRLAKYEPMNTICMMPAEGQRQMRSGAAGQTAADPVAPVRAIRDAYPSFAAIAVDMVRDEIVMTDESLFQMFVYDRLESTPAGLEASTPKRVIAGDNAGIEFQSGLYVDQQNGDIYSPNNDTEDTLVIFSHGSSGNVAPKRTLHTPHGAFGIAVDERRGEVFLTTQHDSAVVVFRKNAIGDEPPVRLLQGDNTGLADPHGIAIDLKDETFFVANHGSRASRDLARAPRVGVAGAGKGRNKGNWPATREYAVPGSGSLSPPSITIHALSASGNTPPLRTIQGPNTGLNWPTGIAFDPETRELFVANDAAHEILVFDSAARGDARPRRILKGPRTKLVNPTSVFVDTKNRELWVANFGGHSATVYDLAVSGDVAPKRIIRNAPEGTPSLMIGNPGAVGFDSKREEILVPN